MVERFCRYIVHNGGWATNPPIAWYPETEEGYKEANWFCDQLNNAFQRGFEHGTDFKWRYGQPKYWVTLVEFPTNEEYFDPVLLEQMGKTERGYR